MPHIIKLAKDHTEPRALSLAKDFSEKLLQRVRGMVSIHVILVKGEYMHQVQIFLYKVFAGIMKLLLVRRNNHHHEGF